MRKIILMAAMLLSMSVMAQEPVITFSKTTHDFGKINEADGRVTTIFEFKNEGMTPLVLSNVRASCGCTTPKWTREPIEPGQTGTITVTYNPNGRPGRFQKTITVTSNASVPTVRLYIKGEVIPKPAKPTEQYPVEMGALRLKKKSLNFGAVPKKEGGRLLEIEYANTTDSVVLVDLLFNPSDNYIKPLATLKELQKGETGKFQFSLQANECPLWGPIEVKVYVVVNGKRKITDDYAITLKADIKEDFSYMSVEDQQQAPILEVNDQVNLGSVKAGKKLVSKLVLSNVGVNPLWIRRVVSTDNTVFVVTPKSAIKSGRKVDAKVEINTSGLAAGNYSRQISIINNDPKKSVTKVTLNWVVE